MIIYGKRRDDGALLIKIPAEEYVDDKGDSWYVIGDLFTLTLLVDKLMQQEMTKEKVIN